MNKPVRVIMLGDAELAYKKLNALVGQQRALEKENTEEMQLLRSINQKIQFIKANPFYGDNIKKEQIPDEYKETYKATNLFRVELSGFWRMLYTVKGDQIEVLCFILEIVDHPAYDKKFGYRKK